MSLGGLSSKQCIYSRYASSFNPHPTAVDLKYAPLGRELISTRPLVSESTELIFKIQTVFDSPAIAVE